MSLDINLLRIMKTRVDYNRLISTVPLAATDPKTKALLQDFGKYFKKFPTHEKIDFAVFIPRFRSWHSGLTTEQFNVYQGMLRQLSSDIDKDTREGILADLFELDLATSVANIAAVFEAGDLNDPLPEAISAVVDAYKMNVGIKAVPWNDTPIEDLLQEDVDETGLKWRLACLNESMRPLRPGDFGIIAGRPDKGKTSFLSSEVTHMVKYLPAEKNVIWINNESTSGRIIKRIYQAALGMTISELVKESKDPKKLRKKYADAVGRPDRIRVVDAHGMHNGQIEAILEQSNPGIVIYDMIDNIHGFAGEARTDLQLESMYQWARERCVKYSCVGLAASQISVEGEGQQYPGMSMLKDSKTGKQGACDFQLMIGAVNDENLKMSRYIGLVKNKLRREGFPKDPHREVLFNELTGIYEEIE